MLLDAGVILASSSTNTDCWRVNLSAKGRKPDEPVTVSQPLNVINVGIAMFSDDLKSSM